MSSFGMCVKPDRNVMCVTFEKPDLGPGTRRRIQTIQHMLAFCRVQTLLERLGTI
jgi:hypothetical protein